jgi:hypothetical protein
MKSYRECGGQSYRLIFSKESIFDSAGGKDAERG